MADKMLAIYCRTSRSRENETTTIDQQITAGTKWANENHKPFLLYVDEGRSGYKLGDEDDDPLSTRPELLKLVNDIKKKKVNAVWVWEHSRLARNTYASGYLSNIFQKYEIEVYEKGIKYDFSNKIDKLTRDIQSIFAEYERGLIVDRTTRGLHTAIDTGFRSYSRFFGYRRTNAKDQFGHFLYEPVEAELELVKIAFDKYNTGLTLNELTRYIQKLKGDPEIDLLLQKKLSTKWHRILSHDEYTGMSLTMDGIKIEQEFIKNDPDAIFKLRDDKFWVKSASYPMALISREQWIQTKIKLAKNRGIRGKYNLVTNLSTGLIRCHACSDGYFYHEILESKTGKRYPYYTHRQGPMRKTCPQSPKTISISKIDALFEFVYWFYYVNIADIRDLVAELAEEQRERVKILQNQIATLATENQKIEKTVAGIQEKLLDEQVDVSSALEMVSNYKRKALLNTQTMADLEHQISGMQFNEDEKVFGVFEEKVREFESATPDKKRELLLSIIDHGTITNRKVIIRTKQGVFYYADLNETTFLKMKQEDPSFLRNIHLSFQSKEAAATYRLIREYGVTGYVVPPSQQVEVAESIRGILRDELQKYEITYQFPDEKFVFYSFSTGLTDAYRRVYALSQTTGQTPV